MPKIDIWFPNAKRHGWKITGDKLKGWRGRNLKPVQICFSIFFTSQYPTEFPMQELDIICMVLRKITTQ